MKYKVEYSGHDIETEVKSVNTLDEVIDFANKNGNNWINKNDLELSFNNGTETYISIYPYYSAQIKIEVIK